MADDDIGFNLEGAVDGIAKDIAAGVDKEPDAEPVTIEPETTPEQDTEQAETTEPTDAEPLAAAPTVRAAPKSWAKEQHERWAKLDKDTQDYIELREKQALEGITQYSESAKFAKAVKDVIQPHMELIRAQQIAPEKAIEYLFNAHRQLSVGTPEQKLAYLASVAKTYGLDLAKAATAAGQQAEEPAYVKELRERQDRLDRERDIERQAQLTEQSQKIEKQVTDFADAKDDKGKLKHPYFDECADHIVKLINGGYSLEDAYQAAIYANPVTKEKELARLLTEKEAALRSKAKQEADRARHASSTNVSSRDTKRGPTAPTAKRWEDTMDETMREIKERQTH